MAREATKHYPVYVVAVVTSWCCELKIHKDLLQILKY